MVNTNLDAIIHNLELLKEQYEEAKGLSEEDKYDWWIDEYGGSLVWQIGCHPVFSDSTPCLNEVKRIEYMEKGWNENCKECKARWLMERYE